MKQADMGLCAAQAAGNHGMAISMERAERSDPDFKAKAEHAILSHLKAVGQCSGEVLTDIAKAHGAVPPSDRAFGWIYKSLLHRKRIHVVGYGPRTKGHGCMGAKIYSLVH